MLSVDMQSISNKERIKMKTALFFIGLFMTMGTVGSEDTSLYTMVIVGCIGLILMVLNVDAVKKIAGLNKGEKE
jgi:hypothetical protein